MLCGNCGKGIDDSRKICPYCQKIIEDDFSRSVESSQNLNNNKLFNNNMMNRPSGQMNNMMNQPAGQINNMMNRPSGQINNMMNQPVGQINNMMNRPSGQMNNGMPLSLSNKYRQKGNSIKKFMPILLVVFVVLALGLFLGNKYLKFKNNSNDLSVSSGTRTIMIYLIASDLESKGAAATMDIEEMLDAKFNSDDVNVIVYAGGTKKWQNDIFDNKENAIYEIKDGEIKKVKSYELKDMTNVATLTEFIDFSYKNYDTDLYDLILWDHGGGPIYGYGDDENDLTSSSMSLLDIDEAINKSQLIKETRFEFIGFDACLMSSIEIANMLKEEANYLIASSEIEPGFGWDYSFLSEIDSNITSEELGKEIVDYYYNFYKQINDYTYEVYGYEYMPDVTLSLINLQNIDSLVESIDDLFEDVDSSINVSTYSKISRDVSKAVMYGYQENTSLQLDLIDLYGLVDQLDGYKNKVAVVKNEFDNSVIYHRSTIDNCYGMSIYFPVTTKSVYNKYDYDDIVISDNYENFLIRYINIGVGDKFVNSNIDRIIPEKIEGDISVTLPNDIAENYQDADYIMFRKVKDGSFLPVYKSKDVSIDGNTITATVINRKISVGDANGNNVEDVIAFESSRDENSITYVLVTVLQRWVGDKIELEVVEMYLKVDNATNEAKIIDIKQSIDASEKEVAGKVTYNLNDWKNMQFVSSSYILHDENGDKLEEWKSTNVYYGTEVNIQEGFKFFASELDKDEEYYYMFRVKDTQGNLYETDLVAAK